MKVLLITSAGLSSRFSNSVGYPCLKCIYYKDKIEESLLYKMLKRHNYFDKVVIVGGFKFTEIEKAIKENFVCPLEKILLIENKKYAEYGSCYSLFIGLKALVNTDFDELVFAEGDLFVDDESFYNVCISKKNVITYNMEPIYADKSVVFYFDINKRLHYIYDTGHASLKIEEPFLSVFNSGQIWKFSDIKHLKNIIKNIKQEEAVGTNLVIISKFFQNLEEKDIDIIGFNDWINCNTVDDFNIMLDRTYGGMQ